MYEIVEKIRNFLRSEVVSSAHIGQHAAVLTLTTLFTLVPMMSGILWAIAQVPEIQGELLIQFETMLGYLVPDQAITWRTRADAWVQDIGQLQTFSAVLFLTSLLFLVNRVDSSLHWVLQLDKRRRKRRWLHYLWVMPTIMVCVVLGMTVVILLQLVLGMGFSALFPGINITSIPVMWVFLAMVYQFSARGEVELRNTIWVSFAVTLSFWVLKSVFAWLYLTLPNWSIVFGIFSAIPLFLLWCQMAWTLFLYGALILRWVSQ